MCRVHSSKLTDKLLRIRSLQYNLGNFSVDVMLLHILSILLSSDVEWPKLEFAGIELRPQNHMPRPAHYITNPSGKLIIQNISNINRVTARKITRKPMEFLPASQLLVITNQSSSNWPWFNHGSWSIHQMLWFIFYKKKCESVTFCGSTCSLSVLW